MRSSGSLDIERRLVVKCNSCAGFFVIWNDWNSQYSPENTRLLLCKSIARKVLASGIPVTDPPIYPLQLSFTSPKSFPALCYAGMVDAELLEKDDFESPPEVGDSRWPVGCKPGHVHWGFTLTRPVWVHLGDVHFSQDRCHPPPQFYIPQSCSGLNRLKGL